ncbi:MAG: hypothetical protein LBH29_01400 [Elusimicrobiota bacterium]|jgi:hypothetical protein|nr:hypothetical protein [Elusimicrobiota bacterium]
MSGLDRSRRSAQTHSAAQTHNAAQTHSAAARVSLRRKPQSIFVISLSPFCLLPFAFEKRKETANRDCGFRRNDTIGDVKAKIPGVIPELPSINKATQEGGNPFLL